VRWCCPTETIIGHNYWSPVKVHVYKNKPGTIVGLNEEIRCVIGELDPEMCQQVTTNSMIQTEACQ